jgi:hypothetical protein
MRKRFPPLSEVGFKVFSQSDEDGKLLYIFSVIGTKSKKSVEICAGHGGSVTAPISSSIMVGLAYLLTAMKPW